MHSFKNKMFEEQLINSLITMSHKRIMSRSIDCTELIHMYEKENFILAFLEGTLLIQLSPLELTLETTASKAKSTHSVSLFKRKLTLIPDKNVHFHGKHGPRSQQSLLHVIYSQKAQPWTAVFVSLLLREGASVNALSSNGDSALIVDCSLGVSDIEEGTVEVLKELLASGAEMNNVNEQGCTALMDVQKPIVGGGGRMGEVKLKIRTQLCQVFIEFGAT